jgi:sugar lactone lactonase YvrE
VAVDATGNLFIADTDNNRIRKVGTNGIISTVAGNGLYTYGDGGAATNAGLSADGVTVDATGNLFIADTYNNRIRKVGADGIIATVAGNGYVNPSNGYGGGYSGDGGAATNAELNLPQGVAVDATGNLFIADTVNNRIREVGTNGIINTVAGNGYVNPYTGSGGYSGDGGAATNAELNGPIDVAVDATGNLFIADTYNNRIRKVGANGIIATVAGNGLYTYGDGGAATNAELYWPFGVAVDATGNVFIADTYNNVIREVGTNGTITTVAGGGTNSLGDGDAAINAELNQPTGVAVDATGNLFIADYFNARIRKVAFDPSVLTPILMLNAVGFENTGVYRVVVSNPYGSTTSSVVTLTVTLPVVLSAPQVIGKTNFTFLLSVPAGSNYVVQASTNLSYWSNVSTSTMPVIGSITLTNAISGYNRRFYRAYLK